MNSGFSVQSLVSSGQNQGEDYDFLWQGSVFLLMLFVSFDTLIVNLSGISGLTYLPNLVLLPFVVIVLRDIYRGVVQRAFLHVVIVFCTLFVISMLSIYYRGSVITAIAIILFIKMFFMLTIMSKAKIDDYCTPIQLFLLVHLAGFVVNFILPGLSIFSETGIPDDNFRISGFQLNANAFAFASAILALYYIFIKNNIAVFVILVGTIFASGSRSGMLFLVLALMYLAQIQGKLRGQILKFVAFAFVAAAIFLFRDRFLDTYDQAQATLEGIGLYVRAAVLAGGVELAIDHFPFGTGAGTFASALAAESPAYRDTGIANLPTVIGGTGIFDSGIGTMLGEYGVLGTIILLVLCYRGALAFGQGNLTNLDAITFAALILLNSFFRNIIPNYYYSGILIFFLMILMELRQRTRLRKSS